jgi:predicted nucleic acid-binding Zn ribbon protein
MNARARKRNSRIAVIGKSVLVLQGVVLSYAIGFMVFKLIETIVS